MLGYQLTFFTQQTRLHGSLTVVEWLTAEAKKLGISGVTVTAAQSGYGRDGELHSAHFFDLAAQPMEITMAVTTEQSERLFTQIAAARLKIFYMKMPIEFGITGEE